MLSVPEKCKEKNPLVFIKPENVLLCGALIDIRIGYLKGKVRIKKAENGKIYVIKTMKLIDRSEADDIRAKKELLQKKKRQKKQQITH